ncbi:MAG: PspC domain-containing protein [Candidatus Hodarchaeales archaeon]
MANYCDKCGKPINPDDIFCNSCGTQVNDSKMSETPRGNPPRQITTQPKLYRSVNDRLIAGVCGGLGRHFNIDPILIRIAFIIGIMGGMGVAVYIILAIFIEEEPTSQEYSPPNSGKPGY